MKGISPEKMTEYVDTVFYYVFDKTNQLVLAAPDDQSEGVAILFLQEQDAERWKEIVRTAPAYRGIDLSVEGDTFKSVFGDSLDYPEFRVLPFGPKGAKQFLSHYQQDVAPNGEVIYNLVAGFNQVDEDARVRFNVEEFRRSVTEVTEVDLLSKPKQITDAEGRNVWVFQVRPGIFNPKRESYFTYDFHICIVESVESVDTVICRKITEVAAD